MTVRSAPARHTRAIPNWWVSWALEGSAAAQGSPAWSLGHPWLKGGCAAVIPPERPRAAPVPHSALASCRRRSDPQRGRGDVPLFLGRRTCLPPRGPRVRCVHGSAMDSLPPCLPLMVPVLSGTGRWPRGGAGARPSVGPCVGFSRGARSGSAAAPVSWVCWEHRARTRLLSGCARTQEPRLELFSRETVEADTRGCDFP